MPQPPDPPECSKKGLGIEMLYAGGMGNCSKGQKSPKKVKKGGEKVGSGTWVQGSGVSK